MTRHSQISEEIRIFKRFAAVCPLGIQQRSIRGKKPPHPDVFCKLQDGSSRLFELGEIVDECLARTIDNSMSLPPDLQKAFEDLPENLKAGILKRHNGMLIGVTARDGVSRAKQRAAYRLLMEFLDSLPAGALGAVPLPPKLARVFRLFSIDECGLEGVRFSSPGVTSYCDPIEGLLQEKFKKTYNTSEAVDLLAYYSSQAPPPRAAWGSRIHGLIQGSLKKSPFERVWVFSIWRDEDTVLLTVPNIKASP